MIAKAEKKGIVKPLTAPLMEIFSSIQGEGAYLGEPQLFVRFARCPLRCLYCDTSKSWTVQKHYQVFQGLGVRELPNPATVDSVLSACDKLDRSGRLTVSLTGGEPLLYPEFLLALAKRLHAEGRRVHLETAGVHPHGLERVLPAMNHISMDWKLASTLETGDFRKVQKEFLRIALRMKKLDLVIKIVITPETLRAEFVEAIQTIASFDATIPVIVQPVTPKRKIRRKTPVSKIQEFTRIALEKLQDVRVLPQLHPLLKMK